jgi:peptidoglycan biosynthesis protein MviN/MurJ (putative lipid II flippase)
VLLARIMFPYLAAMSLVAMLSGILNSFRRYFLAALAPVLLNVVLIGTDRRAGYLGLAAPDIGKALAWSWSPFRECCSSACWHLRALGSNFRFGPSARG